MSKFLRWEVGIVVLLLVGVAYAALFVRVYRVEGPSMKPTLSSGRQVVVDTLWWRLGGLKRRDLVVFVEPRAGQVDIKRVIGLPDQTVYLYTVAQEAGLWYLVLAAPSSRLYEFDPTFRQMIGTVQFPN